MTPEEVGARLTELLAAAGVADGVTAGVSAGNAYARAVVDVPADSWPAALTVARDRLGCDFFDWLSAVDELPEGFAVLVHLWSTAERFGVLVRTRTGRSEPSLPSVVDVYPGAAWHERETFEMFGIGFPGELPPLLLPPEFEGHPLRKEFILASRVAKPWPGAKEPGESESGSAKRAPVRPPGVPSPEEWGPAAHRAAPAAEAAPGAED